ncbi:sulfate/molybdate ABC transporter ATP-binding protein [Gluconacetobacter entanii]|uniref:Sulfate ABC transporter ATP-binding protein n=1 Tax=Gluconacetobacter entanii TaxID=108528 RepID=A0A318PQG2_9PROT|nr:sulfate/molybdate ABC transporter ATP-binding protein [Gluconacetobacter entanii]MCE2578793.1 sulfate/molybdate ABC transporter ATP-binding protein [Komagataeibacter sp. FNDCR1]PYD62700.1 sulfate ABC transporter ATP-binding protein [Gluconacetobacter entanii]
MSVRLENLTRRVGGRPIVDDVSLDVAEGSFTALLGPSGAGKTSLLRIIAGLDPHDGGRVLLNGQRVDMLEARSRNIGFVFQNYALFDHMTVARNIAFGLSIRPRRIRPDRARIAARVEELLELMHLPGMGGRYPHELSGGQRQRVALARALATGPRVLLLDEPFGALDPLVRRSIRGWLRELHDRLGLTTILVTHDRHEASELADTIALMRDGRIVQAGTPQQLHDAPATPFAMEFMHDVTRLPGRVANGAFIADLPDMRPVAVNGGDGPAELLVRAADVRLLPGQGAATAWLRQANGPIGTFDVMSGPDTLRLESVVPPGGGRIVVNCALDAAAGRVARDGRWLEGRDAALEPVRGRGVV